MSSSNKSDKITKRKIAIVKKYYKYNSRYDCYDNNYDYIGSTISDWEEVTDEEFDFINKHLYEISLYINSERDVEYQILVKDGGQTRPDLVEQKPIPEIITSIKEAQKKRAEKEKQEEKRKAEEKKKRDAKALERKKKQLEKLKKELGE